MNEELQKQAIQALQGIIQFATETKDFVVAQAPDVVQQLLRYEFWTSLGQQMSVVFGFLALLVFGAHLLKYRWFIVTDYSESQKNERELPSIVIGCICSVIGIFGTVIPLLCTTTLVWFKVAVAPKIFLIEYAANLIK